MSFDRQCSFEFFHKKIKKKFKIQKIFFYKLLEVHPIPLHHTYVLKKAHLLLLHFISSST